MMTLSDLARHNNLLELSLVIANIGMAAATIPAALTAVRYKTHRSKILVYTCMIMAVCFITINMRWTSGDLIDMVNIQSIQTGIWNLLPFILANGYLIEFMRCRGRCSPSLLRKRRHAIKIKAIQHAEN
ncbi:MAG: hypothetical protein IBX50_04080 [Marinospirillum sp.]|uniref:hypothetical protein n=1 Tax=Marinospirillum sp. TaxID=2183934 RepID=UPI0019E24835|nr:hypothetical protein [Marinospirillum sp.]MBE0505884.1 hypothetical protein [Marinospirillum sp.]